MNISIEEVDTGWFDIAVGLTDPDIALLIERLQLLQQHRGHFHFRRNEFPAGGGVGDVEICWTDVAPANMVIE
jgi:hypothetical protein